MGVLSLRQLQCEPWLQYREPPAWVPQVLATVPMAMGAHHPSLHAVHWARVTSAILP